MYMLNAYCSEHQVFPHDLPRQFNGCCLSVYEHQIVRCLPAKIRDAAVNGWLSGQRPLVEGHSDVQQLQLMRGTPQIVGSFLVIAALHNILLQHRDHGDACILRRELSLLSSEDLRMHGYSQSLICVFPTQAHYLWTMVIGPLDAHPHQAGDCSKSQQA